jgi:phosphoribosylamine--glycine ligase / phosphoribosylformylglycinamidine cyclo-ligase
MKQKINVLVVGSGGREHAITWKLHESQRLDRLWIAPGNPGTANLGHNVNIALDDVQGLVRFAQQEQIDLVVIGPEVSLAAGLADALSLAGIPVFGPSRAAARIETSKSFSKQFMQRHHIPSASFQVFDQLEPALAYLDICPYQVVIKASGLAAGKGVLLPENKEEARGFVRDLLINHRFGSASEEIIIEERLEGEEVSLLAFSDGVSVACMPPAQDHKRLLDGDSGPNTGGMGAYAPAPTCPPEMVTALTRTVLQPTIDGLRKEGSPFVGVLYAGLILTKDGPKVLEFNARFGDPETQVILPLLSTDLLEVFLACTSQKLSTLPIHWQKGSAVCVVMASAGYPEKSSPPVRISGLDHLPDDTLAFQAGTAIKEDKLVAAGGRVLGITSTASDLPTAIEKVYRAVAKTYFQGMIFRKDIAVKGLRKQPSAYQRSGVNIDAGNQAVELMKSAVRSTYDSRVLSATGAFGGLFDASGLQSMNSPVLVASTDGVGTKVKLAASLNRFHGIGMDIVNHCIDDILVQGARPLFFLDYFATAELKPEMAAEIVSGMAEACRLASCALLGGETAEMPGVYLPGEFDVAGTIIGCLDRENLLPRQNISAGDVILGIRSSGPHTNGYSLLRQIFSGHNLLAHNPQVDGTLADALLAPHRSYLELLIPLIEDPASPIKALAHITGGGFIENIPRILPPDLGAEIYPGSWPVPPLFGLACEAGEIDEQERYRVLNMGIGMTVVLDPQNVKAVQALIPEQTWLIGKVVLDNNHRVVIR